MTGATAADISSGSITDGITQAITAHRPPLGIKLREKALARVCNVSRTEIHATLLMLAKDKLIRMEPDHGTSVTKPDETEAREVLAMCRILEIALVRGLITKATPADYRRLEKHLAEGHKMAANDGLSDVPRRNRLMAGFHLPVADMVGNNVLEETLYEFSARSLAIIVIYQSAYDVVRSSGERTALLETAKHGDVEGAIIPIEECMAHTEVSLKSESPDGRMTGLVAALLVRPRMPTYTLRVSIPAKLDIREGRFIGLAVPVEGQTAVMDVVVRLRAEHPTVTYVCWVLPAGGQSGMPDDGESPGIAGCPILEVLYRHDLGAMLGAIVHYFSGVKLDTGGFVRAYTDAIATALMWAGRAGRIASTTLTLATDYTGGACIHHWINDRGYVLLDAAYGAGVMLAV